MKNMKRRIIIYHGDGEGKTSAAIGHAIRAIGHGSSVFIIHFMKGRKDTGEYKFFRAISSLLEDIYIEIVLTGPSQFLKDISETKKHRECVLDGLNKVRDAIISGKYDMIILDEILYATKFGLIDESEIIEILDLGKNITYILTGRDPPLSIIKRADIITEMINTRHHYDEDRSTDPAIDY